MVQNFHLVWLDENIDENNDDYRNSITKLRQVVNNVNTFTDADECLDFISNIQEEKAFVIFSGALSQTIVPVVHDIPQVNTFYMFCENKARHEKWTKEWAKVAGVYTDIVSICEALKQATQDFDHSSISISFAPKSDGAGNENRDTLDCSVMYTQILKEIILTIDFEPIHIKNFLTFCRERFVDNPKELQNVDLIEKDYRCHESIWWYTYQYFLYSMLNRALRLMEVDLIIKMGFFLRDLHNHIFALHREQYAGSHHSHSFTVYRGQDQSETNFTPLKATQGGLLAFNNFLSTSHNREVFLKFVRRTITTSGSMGVLFVMTIDPSLATTPFANVKDVSYYKGWLRLGKLLIQMSQFDKVEGLYGILLQQATTEGEWWHLYHMLGMVKCTQGDYAAAVKYYEKSIAINQKTLPQTHAKLAASYNNIGSVYDYMGEYSKVLSYYEQALKIRQKTLPANHFSLAISYNNIGSMYYNMDEYSTALFCSEQVLEIRQKTLPANHLENACTCKKFS